MFYIFDTQDALKTVLNFQTQNIKKYLASSS